MTRKLGLLLVLLLVLGSSGVYAQEVVRIGASPVPHGDILLQIVPLLAEQGITLEIIEFTDYVLPNLALADGEIDANFFQHTPYLEGFSRDHGLELAALAEIHIEPLGFTAGRFPAWKNYLKKQRLLFLMIQLMAVEHCCCSRAQD